MSRIITLTRGLETVVSDVDYELWRVHKWRAHQSPGSGLMYARTDIDGRAVYLHRAIVRPPAGMKADHVDNDTLNNQRPNLRVASFHQNNANRRFWTATGYKGVTKDGLRYRARLFVGGVERCLGRFDNPVEAAEAYDDAIRAHYGEFAWLNFPGRYPSQGDAPPPAFFDEEIDP